MHKYIADFHDLDGNYIWDYFNLYIQERVENQAPKMYHIGGPYDLISKKAPQRATAYQNGELLINQDITHEVNVRTAAMNFVVLSLLWVTSLSDKKILLFGNGNVWKEFLKLLRDYDWWVDSLDYCNTKGVSEEFESLGSSLGIQCHYFIGNSLQDYDLIVLHTSSRTPVITKELFATVKVTAIITSFSGSQPELEWWIYNQNVQVIIDRDQTILNAKNLGEQIESGNISRDSILTIEDLLNGKKPSIWKPVIYRSTGAPMQSLAILQLM